MNQGKAIGFLLERSTRMIKLSFHQLFKANGLDITPEQWVILDILYANQQLSQKEIANKSFKDAPSVSRILDGLTKKDLIRKTISEIDKRLTFVCLSQKGEQLVRTIYPKVTEVREQGVKGIEQEELATMIDVINRIFENYNN